MREAAIADLHALLLRGARFELSRRRASLGHLPQSEREDIATQAADDALVAILAKLDSIRARAGSRTLRSRGVEPELVAADAAPDQAVVQAARDRDADLIVVGSTGSGCVTRAIVGSTAENLVRQGPCDVLIVR